MAGTPLEKKLRQIVCDLLTTMDMVVDMEETLEHAMGMFVGAGIKTDDARVQLQPLLEWFKGVHKAIALTMEYYELRDHHDVPLIAGKFNARVRELAEAGQYGMELRVTAEGSNTKANSMLHRATPEQIEIMTAYLATVPYMLAYDGYEVGDVLFGRKIASIEPGLDEWVKLVFEPVDVATGQEQTVTA